MRTQVVQWYTLKELTPIPYEVYEIWHGDYEDDESPYKAVCQWLPAIGNQKAGFYDLNTDEYAMFVIEFTPFKR